MKTRERILETARDLFNKEGVAQVSANRIAAEIGISPGNLYYHFKSKEALLVSLFRKFERALEPFRQSPEGLIALDDLWLALHLAFEKVDEHRWIYRDIDYLMREFPGLQKRTRDITAQSLEVARSLCRSLVTAGVLRATPEVIDVLALQIVLTSTCWSTFAKLMPTNEVGADATGRAAYQVLTLLMPYVGEPERQFLSYLRAKYMR